MCVLLFFLCMHAANAAQYLFDAKDVDLRENGVIEELAVIGVEAVVVTYCEAAANDESDEKEEVETDGDSVEATVA